LFTQASLGAPCKLKERKDGGCYAGFGRGRPWEAGNLNKKGERRAKGELWRLVQKREAIIETRDVRNMRNRPGNRKGERRRP